MVGREWERGPPSPIRHGRFYTDDTMPSVVQLALADTDAAAGRDTVLPQMPDHSNGRVRRWTRLSSSTGVLRGRDEPLVEQRGPGSQSGVTARRAPGPWCIRARPLRVGCPLCVRGRPDRRRGRFPAPGLPAARRRVQRAHRVRCWWGGGRLHLVVLDRPVPDRWPCRCTADVPDRRPARYGGMQTGGGRVEQSGPGSSFAQRWWAPSPSSA